MAKKELLTKKIYNTMNLIADRYQTSLRDKLGMYASLLDFRYKNLCIKTYPEALLPVEVKTKMGETKLEEVAMTGIMDDEHFLVVPKEQRDMMQVCHAFLMAHPQLKQEIVELDKSEDLDEETKSEIETHREIMKAQTGEDLPPINGLVLTTPEINDDMMDQMDKAVDALEKQCEVKFQAELADHKARMLISMTGAEPKELDKANSDLDDMYDKCWEIVEDMTLTMHNDIAHANELYHEREEEKNRQNSNDPRNNMSDHDQKVAFSYNPNAAFEE